MDHSWYLATLLLKVRVDKLLLEHVGLPHVLDLAVHLVNFFGWMSQGGHSERATFTISTLLPEHSFMIKSYQWWGGGLVAHVILVSAQVLWVLTWGFGLAS